MRHIIRKVFWIWNFDKEEKWLNEMAAKGLALISVGFCKYEFEDSLPGEYTVRMEMLQNERTHPETHKYLSFMEETGAEQVGYLKRWVYFRRKSEAGPFEIFSDHDSRIKHLKRIISFVLTLSILNFLVGIYNVIFACFNGYPANFIMGCVNSLLGIWSGWGTWCLVKKKKKLEKEKQIYE